MVSAQHPHSFIGISEDASLKVINTSGNENTHLILRGGNQPNYDNDSIQKACETLSNHKFPDHVFIDCSHGNSNKNYKNQPNVFKSIIPNIINRTVFGAMLESNLNEGNQPLTTKESMKYGVSITDSCINWKTTEEIILDLYNQLI